MNDIGVLYEAVSVEKELSEDAYPMHFVICNHLKLKEQLNQVAVYRKNINAGSCESATVKPTHWLRSLTSDVPISVERLEALEKCVDALELVCKQNKGCFIGEIKANEALTNLETIK